MAASEPSSHSKWRFRWREWAVVAVIVAILIALLWPAVQMAIDSGSANWTQHNLKYVGLAAHNFSYHERRGTFPSHAAAAEVAGAGNPVPSWQTVLLPFADAGRAWDAYDLTQPYDHPANAAVVEMDIPLYVNSHPTHGAPTTTNGFGLSHYAGNVHVLGQGGEGRLDHISDGLSETVLAGQVAGFYKPWADPTNLRDPAAGFGFAPQQFGRPSYPSREADGTTDGAFLLMCDGSTRYFSAETDPDVLAALGTPVGGERLEEWDLWGESQAEWERRNQQRRERLEAGSGLTP